MMQRIGLGLTLLRIMTLWGIATLLLAFADSRFHFYGLRFLIGLAEAGFLPGVLLYLTYWFPERMRGRMTSFVMAALPVSGIIGGPLAGWIMTATHGMLGLKGWQYLFLIEGIPAIALGIFAYFFIARDPEHASWLDDSERAVLAKEIASGRGQTDGQPRSFAAALADNRVWGLALCYFTFYCVENALLVWIPTLLRSVGSVSIFQIGWISGAISLVSMVGMQTDQQSLRCRPGASLACHRLRRRFRRILHFASVRRRKHSPDHGNSDGFIDFSVRISGVVLDDPIRLPARLIPLPVASH